MKVIYGLGVITTLLAGAPREATSFEPVEFRWVERVVDEGKRRRFAPAALRFDDTGLELRTRFAAAGSASNVRLPYADILQATYRYSRLPPGPQRSDRPPFLLSATPRHWLLVAAETDRVLLRVDEALHGLVRQQLEARIPQRVTILDDVSESPEGGWPPDWFERDE